jgi:hypothetical protein
MSSRFKEVIIGSETHQIPLPGASAPWGEELSDLLDALVNAINIVQGPQDIQETSATILNTSGVKEITGLNFDTSQLRSVEISYNLSRTINKAVTDIPTGTSIQTITCSDEHDLFTGDLISIASSNSTPSIDGIYTITKIDANTFSIDYGVITVTVAGTSAIFPVDLVESGTWLANYSTQGWKMTEYGVSVGAGKVVFDIGSSGQATYSPVVLEGTTHVGLFKFIAKALLNS